MPRKIKIWLWMARNTPTIWRVYRWVYNRTHRSHVINHSVDHFGFYYDSLRYGE